MIAGVCAGLADYFGFNLKATRFLAVVSLLMAMPITLLAYFGAVFLIPAAPDVRRSTVGDEDFARPFVHRRRKPLRMSDGDFSRWIDDSQDSKDM